MKNLTKKIGALFILSIFVIGIVPTAFAFEANKWDKTANQKWQKASNQIKWSRTTFKETAKGLNDFLSDVKKRNTVTLNDAEEVRNRLLSSLDKLSKEINKIKDSANKNSCLPDDKTNNYVDMVQGKITTLSNDISGWDAATSTNPRNDLNNFLKRMRNFYREDFSGIFYQAVGNAGACKAHWVLNQVDKVITKAEELEVNAKANGKNTSSALVLIDDMKSKQAKLESDYEKLILSWKSIENHRDAAQVMKEVNNYVKDAVNVAKEIYRQLKSVYREIKNQ